MNFVKSSNFVAIALIFLLNACAMKGGILTTVGPNYQKTDPVIAKQWNTKQVNVVLAHEGNLSQLKKWWQGFNDPVLNRLLDAAQKQSATVAQAKANIERARAELIGTDSLLLPSLDSSLGASRSSFSFGQAPFIRNQYSASLQSSWEIDLFGGLAREQEAAISHLEAQTANWHDARVAVSVEVANAYLGYRYCEAQVRQLSNDAESRQTSKKILEIAGAGGFRSVGEVALANASSAEANKNLLQQKTQCQKSIKGLVAMTGLDEQRLRHDLMIPAENIGKLPKPLPFQIKAIPIEVIRQRPDITMAERKVAEASAKIGVEQASRYPKLNLTGSITPVFQNINAGALVLANTWSFGPTLSLPLFDGGKRAAKVDAARADYLAAISQYQASVRTAVKEVEEALLRLQSVEQRFPEARSALAGYQTSFTATQQLFAVGLGNLLDVEASRRSLLNAELALTELEQEKVSAWIALYRAAGGSWTDQEMLSLVSPQPTSQLEKKP